MDITVSIELTDSEKTDLANTLKCPEANLQSILSNYGKAALEEYIRMFLGQKVYSRGSDLLEYRLLLLIEYVFGNTIPNEQQVSDLFQSTATTSRGRIRSVMSKFQYELKSAIDGTLRTLIESAQVDTNEGDDTRIVVINCENLVDELNRIIASIDGTLPPVSKKRGTASTYQIMPSSYSQLCNRFNIQTGGNTNG